MSAFFQRPPILPPAWAADEGLRDVVHHHLDPGSIGEADRFLDHVGRVVTSPEVIELGLTAEKQPPEHIPFSTWGERVDEIRVSPAYSRLGRIGVELGITALPYERSAYGDQARVVWAALLALWGPSSALYSCPVAMTDAAARTLLVHGGPEELEVVHHLTTRDPDEAWTSGQWMTETSGGSDVGGTATEARHDDGTWRLYGTKWFTSATTSEMALTLARPQGAPAGSRGLALFKILRTLPDGTRNRIIVRRLKDKLGTRAMPTAELELDGAIAEPVGDPSDGRGLPRIATMLNITRLHNALGSVGSMGRGLAWARSFAEVRTVFGKALIDQPLHRETLAEMHADYMHALVLAFRCAELTGRAEAGSASEEELAVLRAITPIAKLSTARLAVASAAEAMEALGGVGYCEDSGLPALVRNAHVLPIWEGTTNVLSLDLLRAERRDGAMTALSEEIRRAGSATSIDDHVSRDADVLESSARRVLSEEGGEAGARRLALGLGLLYAKVRLAEMAAAGSRPAEQALSRLLERRAGPLSSGIPARER